MKPRVKSFIICAVVLFCQLCLYPGRSYAVNDPKQVDLSKQIMEAKDCSVVKTKLGEMGEIYFKENKYGEFVDFLNSVLKQKNDCPSPVNYYIALARYQQLKYLEESQGWDEYFAQGNDYRTQITESAQKALETSAVDDPLAPATQLLLWQFHRDQQDTFHEQALNDLVNSLNEYAKDAKDTGIIKLAADKIYSYGEKGKAKEIYRLYVSKIIASSISDDELSNIAAGFLKEGNIELAESIYDVYIERLSKNSAKEKLCPVFIGLAKEFALGKDMLYAEKLFAKIIETVGPFCLDEALNYLRALNLEKAKEYAKARDLYLDFSQKYPQSIHHDEAIFKAAVIDTYILRDRKTGSDYFVKLTEQEKLSSQSISALYHLGLLAQWDNDAPKAKAYYNKLLEKAGQNFPEAVLNVKERLKEIEASQPLENNLKLFLDLTFKEVNSQFNMSGVNLTALPYFVKKDIQATVDSNTNEVSAGCMPVDWQYFWSGDLGSAKPQANMAGFPTSYKEPGTKVIFLVVAVSGSYLDRALDMLDVE
ncbi:MAG: hypothetical protein WC417_02605 [Candidatus Omnitrophota bacterium]|jgi:TolA-binding protein